jgi:hypothetical protein
MSTNAVIPDSASGEEREPASHFLPSDKNYRLTGQLPDTEPEVAGTQVADKDEHIPAGLKEGEQPPPEKEDASAASESETAAASEAAPQQRKTPQSSENRWAKITRENRELRERLARLEGRAEAIPQREVQQAAPPAMASAEPKIDDVDASGNPKYKTLADYLSAVRKYDRDSLLKEVTESTAKSQREQQQRQYEQVIERTVQERAEAARKAYPDYEPSMEALLATQDEHGRDAFFYTKGSPIDAYFLDSERGHDVMYAIAKNFDQHRHIFARDAQGNYLLNPVRQLRELAKIEASLAVPGTAPPAKKVTQAPPPPHQVQGKAAVNKDAVAQAVEEGDTETYIREQNARILARRKKG